MGGDAAQLRAHALRDHVVGARLGADPGPRLVREAGRAVLEVARPRLHGRLDAVQDAPGPLGEALLLFTDRPAGSSYQKLFLQKYDTLGAAQWLVESHPATTGEYTQNSGGIVIDSAGTIYVAASRMVLGAGDDDESPADDDNDDNDAVDDDDDAADDDENNDDDDDSGCGC